jgi:hypothetical protein
MTTSLPTEDCEAFFTHAIRCKHHGQLGVGKMLSALAKELDIEYFNRRNEHGEKIMYWIIRYNYGGILSVLIERFGDIVLQDLDSAHQDALAIANAFNEDARLESIIYLLEGN